MRLLAVIATLAVATTMTMTAGCDGGGPQVAFNQRTFALPSMTPSGSTCMVVQLGDSDGSSSGGGGAQGLIMTIRVANDQLFVEVFEGRTTLVRRGYDEAFFQSQRVDEFKVTATTGDGMLVRNWGSYGPGGQPECASPVDDGSPMGQRRTVPTVPAQQP
jgi:hypothetical protein